MVSSTPLSLGSGNGMGLDIVSNDQFSSGDCPAMWQYDEMGNVVSRPRSLAMPNMHGGYVSDGYMRSNLMI